MKHLILGSGRLGKALFKVLSADKDDHVTMWPMRANGLTDEKKVAGLLIKHGLENAVIWNCMGFGSVKECKADPEGAELVHVDIPMAISEIAKLAGSTAIHFSSDYAVAPELSEYAKSKKKLEDTCHRSAIVIRVANLYSAEDPKDSLFGRLIDSHMRGTLRIAENFVYPTPVEWLATFLCWSQVWKLPNGVYKAIPHGDPLPRVAQNVLPHGAITAETPLDLDLERPMQYEEVEPYSFAKDLLPKGHKYHWWDIMKSHAPNLYETVIQQKHMDELKGAIADSVGVAPEMLKGGPETASEAMFI